MKHCLPRLITIPHTLIINATNKQICTGYQDLNRMLICEMEKFPEKKIILILDFKPNGLGILDSTVL